MGKEQGGGKEQGEKLRRAPQQARGKARVEQILGITERLLVERGYDALTTNAIAAEAGISVGALYHFFPNKVAILEALIARYYEGLLEVIRRVHTGSAALAVEPYVETLLTELSDFVETSPSLTPAFLAAASASANLELMDRKNKAEMVVLLAARYEAWGQDKKTSRRVARMVTAVLDMLFTETAEDNEEANQVFVEETGRLLYVYLTAYFHKP